MQNKDAQKDQQATEEQFPQTMPELEAMLADLDEQLKACEEQKKELMAAENPAKGIFYAAEIHENRQQKNQLEVTRQFAQVRINRLRMEAEHF